MESEKILAQNKPTDQPTKQARLSGQSKKEREKRKSERTEAKINKWKSVLLSRGDAIRATQLMREAEEAREKTIERKQDAAKRRRRRFKFGTCLRCAVKRPPEEKGVAASASSSVELMRVK